MNTNNWQIKSHLKKKYKMLIKKEFFELAQMQELSTTKMSNKQET